MAGFDARLAGPPLHIFDLAAGEDYARGGSFTAQATANGDVTYITYGGDGTAVTESLTAGDIVGVHCGLPTRLRAIVGATTTATLRLGVYDTLGR